MAEVFSINENLIKKIETLASKFNLKSEQVMSMYMGNYSQCKDEKLAFKKTAGMIQEEYGNLVSGAPTLYVYVLDDFGTSDIFELMRGKSKRLYENPETQQKAIDDGVVSFDGIPLDYRKMLFGKPNENYGQPLVGTAFKRSILAILGKDANFSTGATFVELSADGDNAKDLPNIGQYKFYAFRGNIGKKDETKVSISSGTKFKEYTPDITVAELAAKLTTITIDEAEGAYQSIYAGKKKVSTLVAIKGSVTNLSLNPIKGNRAFVLFDDDSMSYMRCKIAERANIAFKETDDIIIFTSLFPGKDGKIGAQVRTYMVV